LFVSQNDGTLISAAYAARYPVLTFGSGPTNSMRGAAFLTGMRDAIVMDVGGTTTDIGALVNGFPRESSLAVDIGGVRTNFRMPDILSIGLGGGTAEPATAPRDALRIGPDSVGYRLLGESLSFGGSIAHRERHRGRRGAGAVRRCERSSRLRAGRCGDSAGLRDVRGRHRPDEDGGGGCARRAGRWRKRAGGQALRRHLG
jgi:N-methylhydantoinase A/oxoprolinase/acetone carboxylase beta subunit